MLPDRAQLYFRGKTYNVGIDELNELMHLGVDLLIIEKEGVVDVLGPFADRYGIALMYTRGFLTEYASKLSKLAKFHNANIAILTDFDFSGLHIAVSCPGNIPRIGIDLETVKSLGFKKPDKLVGYYRPKKDDHLKSLQKHVQKLLIAKGEGVEIQDPYDLVRNVQ